MKPYPHYCWIAPILTVIFLVGCNQKGEVPVTGLIDQSGTDSTVRPQDDFFNYANQSWIKKTEIPPSQFAWGAFMTIRDQALNNLRTILDSLTNAKDLGKNTAGQRVADLYSSIMDSTMIESKGLSSLKEDMDHINAIKDVPGLLDEVARENTEGINVLFDMSVGPDDKNSLKNMVQFNQGGMGLPTKDYYFKQDSSIKR